MSATNSSLQRKGGVEKTTQHTRIHHDAMIQDKYEVGEKIGQGTFGKVYEATHKSTGMKWAIKSINKEKAGSSAIRLVEREVAILKQVNHTHIITLNEVIESPKKMYLVMEICTGGELADVLKHRMHFTEEETKTIIQRLSNAISYLHKIGIVHRDLKLENILMGVNPHDYSDKLHVKVTDFGLSVVKGGVTADDMMQEFCGTPIYMAPEILDNKAYSQQCDVWALGIIMYTLLCGYPPFHAKDESTLSGLIRDAKVCFSHDDERWTDVSQECKNCIIGMLKSDPAHRLSAAEVYNHPWITGKSQDSTEPGNVLEMMKRWKHELMVRISEEETDHFEENSILGHSSISVCNSLDAMDTLYEGCDDENGCVKRTAKPVIELRAKSAGAFCRTAGSKFSTANNNKNDGKSGTVSTTNKKPHGTLGSSPSATRTSMPYVVTKNTPPSKSTFHGVSVVCSRNPTQSKGRKK